MKSLIREIQFSGGKAARPPPLPSVSGRDSRCSPLSGAGEDLFAKFEMTRNFQENAAESVAKHVARNLDTTAPRLWRIKADFLERTDCLFYFAAYFIVNGTLNR